MGSSNTLAVWWEELTHWKDWGQEEKGLTEDEMVGWQHQLNGHEFEQTVGDSEGQGSLACCSSWSCKELDTTEWLDWTERVIAGMSELCRATQKHGVYKSSHWSEKVTAKLCPLFSANSLIRIRHYKGMGNLRLLPYLNSNNSLQKTDILGCCCSCQQLRNCLS